MRGYPAYPGSRVGTSDFTAQTVLAYYRTATGDVKASSTHQHGAANDSVTASAELLQFVRFFERQTGRLVRTLHTDGGTEFSRAASDLREMGVEVHTTTPYTAPSNCLAERSHGVIVALARKFLSQANLPFKYWNYAVRHVVDCKNAVPHSTTKKVPHEAMFERKPTNLVHVKTFGSRMHYQLNKAKLPTFQERAQIVLCLLHEGGGVYHVLTR